MPTDRKSRKAIVALIQARFPPSTEAKMIDLGSGYGHLLKNLAKSFRSASIIGVELLWLPYKFSKFAFSCRKNVKVVRGNLYEQDLSSYDVIIFFLRKNHEVDEKLAPQFKKGAIVISNNFPLKTFEPIEIKEVKDFISTRKVYCYQF